MLITWLSLQPFSQNRSWFLFPDGLQVASEWIIWGGNSWPWWAFVWRPVDDQWDVHGIEVGKTPGPCQPRASCTLRPVVFFCSVVVSCSSSQALASCSPCMSPFPGWNHWLDAPVFGLFGGIPNGTLSSGTLHFSHHPRKWPSTWPLACFSSSSFGIISLYSSSSELHPLQQLSHSTLHLPGGGEWVLGDSHMLGCASSPFPGGRSWHHSWHPGNLTLLVAMEQGGLLGGGGYFV